MEENKVKLAILEQKIEDLKPIVLRIDAAIEKLSEVNTTVSRMLAVHEERITKQEEIDTVLFAKIDKLRDKMDSDHDSVLQRLRGLEKRVWMAVGGLAVLTFLMNNNQFTSRILTPVPEPVRIQRGAIEG
jgi:chromosome segregation ATPase